MKKGILGLLFLILVLLTVGSYSIMVYEGWSLFDSFYYVLVTITTVGYGDLITQTYEGRIITIFLLIFGIGAVFSLIPLAFSYFIEKGIRSALGIEPTYDLKDHIILCWYNSFSNQALEDIMTHDIPFIMVEKEDAAIAYLKDLDIPYVKGDPGEERSLEKAMIKEARTIILASTNDSENVFTAIAARNLNPNVHIIARVNSNETIPIYKGIGVNTIINPQEITLKTLVNSALSPFAADLVDKIALFEDINLGQFQVASDSRIAGKTISDSDLRKITGASIVAVWTKEELQPNPPADTVLLENYVLLVLGNDLQLRRAKEIIEGVMGKKDIAVRDKEVKLKKSFAADEIRVRMPKVILNFTIILWLFVVTTVIMPSFSALWNLIPHIGNTFGTLLPMVAWIVIALIAISMLDDMKVLLGVLSDTLSGLFPGKTSGKSSRRVLMDILYAGATVMVLALVTPLTAQLPPPVATGLTLFGIVLPLLLLFDAGTIVYKYVSILVDSLAERIAGEVEK